MTYSAFSRFVCSALFLAGFASAQTSFDGQARARQGDLAFGSYATAHTVQRLAGDEALRKQALERAQALGLTTMFLEVYRSGTIVSTEDLAQLRDFFQAADIQVVGGIATVPGGDFGVHQEGPLGWFNWQNEKTQRDLKALMTDVAPLFDTFIIDDFLCTGDVSAESQAAKGDRTWGEYRRDLMVQMAEELFVKPARAVNPDIVMILKYPQWYDRFHLFGYDTARLPQLFDRIWVGTEVRDARTQRFGFTQMYEAYTNYRWLASVSGERIGGAWFDHIECGDYDVLDQAYMSVLAGAQEFTLFNFSNILEGHPDHARLIAEYDQLADLAVHVKNNPVVGAMAYKPPNSEPGGDMYLFDFLGMLGASIVPTAVLPDGASVLFLGTQAAADPEIANKARGAHEDGATLILTSGFLASAAGASFTQEAGIEAITLEKMRGDLVDPSGAVVAVPRGLDLAAQIQTGAAEILLTARVNGNDVPFVTKHNNVFVINTRTFDQQDFDAVGEVLLSPRELGILDVPPWAASIVRAAFNESLGFRFEAPSRVTCQLLADGSFVVQSNRLEPCSFTLQVGDWEGAVDVFTGKPFLVQDGAIQATLPARGRVWIAERALE